MNPPTDKNRLSTPGPAAPKPGPEEEASHLDDAVIGRAFRWSLMALLGWKLINAIGKIPAEPRVLAPTETS